MENKIMTLPAGRLSKAEKKAGARLAEAKDGQMPLDLLIALAWQVLVHEGQNVTFDQVGDQYSIPELTEIIGVDGDEDDPKEN